MSEVKVNKVSSRTGNAVTLGNSGDTLTVPSGVTITSAGTVSGGFKDIQWQSVVTADGSTSTTAEAGKGYPIDTTSAAHTINLPASPSVGDTVAVIDYAGTFATNNVTLGRNSSNIQGAAANGTIATNRRAITFVYIDSTQGWIPINDNTTDNYGALYVAATGGTETTTSDYKIHTFTSSGCFTVSCAGNSAGSNSVDYLVVAGGGSGAAHYGGAGAGGGFRESSGAASGGYSASPLGACVPALSVTSTTYPITVGGGASTTCNSCGTPGIGNDGSNSVFSTITATGGGGGGNGAPGDPGPAGVGRPGGSGGGGGWIGPSTPKAGGTGNTPPVSPSQGNNGGTGSRCQSTHSHGGGGGGATQTGFNAGGCSQAGGNYGRGGDGATTSISGTATAYAGGGGGSVNTSPTQPVGGAGGGGTGGSPGGTSTNGTANTGGGAGSGPGAPNSDRSAGGSGVVIIRYKYQ